ncbi:nucleoside-diphosphate sugar epimerase/dehydratase [Tibeticola sp.]|uniref:polysaccharide biosynthesis protein n=1 Tax=Tibeticola sp. TaxID=2005368 RepID=UPI0025FE65DE|nr:nucleoside-diphosphate sugar epimerase/dehydratase [Tibeticola sp.]
MMGSAARWLQLPLDLALAGAAWWAAFWLRFNLDVPEEFSALMAQTLAVPVLAFALALAGAGVYRHIWRYTSLAELQRLVAGVAAGALFTAVAVLMLRVPNFPRSVLLLHPLLVLLALGGVRALSRLLAERRAPRVPGAGVPALLLGSVAEAAQALRTLKDSARVVPVGIVSPQREEVGRALQGVRVLGTLDGLPQAVQQAGARVALVLAAPGSAWRREALLAAAEHGLSLLSPPRADDWLQGEGAGPRAVALEDLLGRAPVQLDVAGLSEMLAGRTVLVTGAGGSIGSELCRQIARFGVARLVCVDVSEYAVYRLEQDLRAAHPQLEGVYYTANVRELQRLRAIAQAHRPAVVFHAAAYKHVPLMETHNEIEALRTNVRGTLNAAQVAGEVGAARFVLVSTDKAVNPTNVMGASKRLAELAVQALAGQFPQTRFVAVRFGNVLGSSGSVVPLFTEQIARGGPVTVTHPEIVRYFMTIPEAAQLVLQAALMGQSGQIFVLDMGEPVRIVDLAKMLIRLSGKSEQDVPIVFTGLRPGEKLYEELLANDETTDPTPHPKLRVARSAPERGAQAVLGALVWIEEAGAAPDAASLRRWLREQVPEYRPRGEC